MQPWPVIEAELRKLARPSWVSWGRMAMASPLLLPLLWVGGPGAMDGLGFFRACEVWTALLAMFGGLLLTLDVVGRERREGTLDLLFLTPLGPSDVLLGKLAAAGIVAGQFLLATLPVASIGFLVGGPGAQDVAWAAAGVLNLLFVSLAMGLAASALGRTPLGTWVLGLLLGLAVHGLLPWMAGVMHWIGWTLAARATSWLAPMMGVAAWRPNVGWLPGDSWIGLVASHGLGWLFLAWARFHLRRGERKAGGAGARRGRPRAVRWERAWNGEQRVARLAGASGWMRWLGPMLAWGGLALVCAAAWAGVAGRNWGLMVGLGLVGASAWQRALYAWELARFFHEGRTSGMLEMLLTTPVGGDGFMRRFWREAMAGWMGPVLTVHGAALAWAMLQMEDWAWGVVFVNLSADASQLPWLVHAGAWIGLTRRSMTTATLWVVLGVVLVPTGLMLVCFAGAGVGVLQGVYFRHRMRNPLNEMAAGLGPRWTPLDGILHPMR